MEAKYEFQECFGSFQDHFMKASDSKRLYEERAKGSHETEGEEKGERRGTKVGMQSVHSHPVGAPGSLSARWLKSL